MKLFRVRYSENTPWIWVVATTPKHAVTVMSEQLDLTHTGAHRWVVVEYSLETPFILPPEWALVTSDGVEVIM